MSDSEILERLIYRAYIAPDPHAPLEAEALLPFQSALRLYARTANAETRAFERKDIEAMIAARELKALETCGADSCPVDLSEVSDPDAERERETVPGPMTAGSALPSSSPGTLREKNVRSTRV